MKTDQKSRKKAQLHKKQSQIYFNKYLQNDKQTNFLFNS